MTALSTMDLNLMNHALKESLERLSGLAASSAVAGLWQGLMLAAGTGLCLRLVRQSTAAMRFAAWTAVFGTLALLPLVHAYLWHRAAGGGGAVLHADERWSVIVAALWLTASAVRGVGLVVGAARLRGIWMRAVPVDAAALRESAASEDAAGRGDFGLRDDVMAFGAARGRRVQLCTSADVDRPSVIGFFSPRILIPADLFARLTAAELEQIVLHEAGHLRRSDDWWNLLQKVSLVLVPLNPALFWIERRLCLERELACDDDVLRLTKSPKAYATCLTNLAEHRLGQRLALLSLGAWERQSQLVCRVHRILRRGEAMSQRQARVVMASFAVALLGGAAELARCPQLVSFSRSELPVASEARGLQGAAYQPVVFHPVAGLRRSQVPQNEMRALQAAGTEGGAHEVLLRATMPGDNGLRPASRAMPKRRRSAALHVLPSPSSRVWMRTKIADGSARRGQGWLVLTAWTRRSVGAIERKPATTGRLHWEYAEDIEQQIPFGDDIKKGEDLKAGRSDVGFAHVSDSGVLPPGSEFTFSYVVVPAEAGWLVIQL